MSWSLQIPPVQADDFSDNVSRLIEEKEQELETQNPGCMPQVAAVAEAAYSLVDDGGSGLTGEIAGYLGGHYSQPGNDVPNSISFNLYQVRQPT